MILEGEGLAELHTHLGGSVASDILWSIAHEQGIALPVKDYWEFDALVTVSDPHGVQGLDELDQIYHWTELIQSSPLAVERSVHGAIGGAYRSQRITTLELRFNPMKRNRGGERDLDHIILAAIRGVDRASIEYPQVRAGLILMMDRTFDLRLNEIIVEKAIRWAGRGIVGIDIAGPRPGGGRYDYAQLEPMVETRARRRTRHDDPRRRGGRRHGPRGDRRGRRAPPAGSHRPRDPRGRRRELMASIRDLGITLEICPTSNLLTKALPDEDAVRETVRTFAEHDVPFTIATDGPEMMRTHLRDELELLLRIGALDEPGCARRTRAATLPRSGADRRRRARVSDPDATSTALEAESAGGPEGPARAGAQRAPAGAALAHPGRERAPRLPARDHLHGPVRRPRPDGSATSTSARSSARPSPSSSSWLLPPTTASASARATRTTCCARRTARRSQAPSRARSRSRASSTS